MTDSMWNGFVTWWMTWCMFFLLYFEFPCEHFYTIINRWWLSSSQQKKKYMKMEVLNDTLRTLHHIPLPFPLSFRGVMLIHLKVITLCWYYIRGLHMILVFLLKRSEYSVCLWFAYSPWQLRMEIFIDQWHGFCAYGQSTASSRSLSPKHVSLFCEITQADRWHLKLPASCMAI